MRSWKQLGRVGADRLRDARLQLHWATQIVMAAAETLLEAADDDSHTSMGWDDDLGALVGRAVGGRAAGLRLADMTLLVVEGGAASASLALDGRTLEEGLAWLTGALGSDEPLAHRDYDMPAHRVARGEAFDAGDGEALQELSRWYANADYLLRAIGGDRDEPRCWPHHFDMAILWKVATPAGERQRSLGIGMSPGDPALPEGYWYVEAWPYPGDRDPMPPLAHGRWYHERWGGAALDASTLQAAGDAEAQERALREYLGSAIEGCYRLFGARRLCWHRAADLDTLPEGRVMSVTLGLETVCLTHYEGQYAALNNRCPHQGGPLGEGSIENGYLRCPWHGWDYHPLTGRPPGGYDDAVASYPVDVREDGVYVALEEEAPHTRTVSDRMAETMVSWGVRHVWGMVGHSNLGLADALRRQESEGKLAFYGIRHEGAASFAASAYGKLTGRLAACLAIAGPGATNLLTGLWDANVDRSPVLALTGQVQTQVLGTGAFQEVDLKAAFGRVAQWSADVQAGSDHAELMTLACKSALVNRGVSHLIFPDEVQDVPSDAPADDPAGRMAEPGIAPPESALAEAAGLLQRSRRPVIIVGHGARFHMDAIVDLAEHLGAPVITTFKGKGQISDFHALGCGVLGRSGTPIASWFMNESDVLLVFGASFSNHTGITPKKPTIQVDMDRMALSKWHAIDVPVWGEIGATVARLRDALVEEGEWTDQRPEIAARWAIWRAEKARRRADDRGRGLDSATIFATLTESLAPDAIIAVDVGNNTYSFGRYFECRAQRVLMSGYLGSIGFALPAAMGAWAATCEEGTPWHGRQVVAVSGDGGLGQYLAELTTLVKYGMNVTHVVLNNSELGKISKEQRAGQWRVWQTALHNPSFAEIASSCGLHAARVDQADALAPALAVALAHPGPALVEIVADPMLI